MAEKKTDNRISDREIHRQAVKNVKNANRPAPVKPRPDNRGLSDEAERRRIRAEKAENERRKRAGREAKRENRRALMSFIGRRIRLYGPTFILSLFIICIIALSLFLMSLLITKKDGSDMPPEITYTVGEKAEVIKTSAITFNGIIYTDFSSVAKMCGMSVSGDYTHLKFHTGGDEIAVFSSSSDYVVINGSQIRMEGPSKLIEGSLWVPLSFIDRYVDGISVILSDDKTSLSVLQDAITDGEVITPVTVSFLMKDERPLDGLGEGNVPEHAITLPGGSLAYVFANNLSSYYRYMNPTDTEKYLKLINPSVRDDGTFVPDDLTNVLNVQSGKTGVQIDYGAEKSLEALFIEMYSAGLRNVYVSKGYSSYANQKKQYDVYIYNERYWYKTHTTAFSDNAYNVLGKSYIKKTYTDAGKKALSAADAQRVVTSYYAYPGTGDHQTGLAVDFTIKSSTADFSTTDVYAWLKDNAYKFGFIERYPKGKEKITGCSAEAKHWRFVGQVAAAKIHDGGMCLEEYIASLN